MSSPVINCDFEKFGFYCCETHRFPPVSCKRTDLIHAVVQNDFEVFVNLLDSPELYNTQDRKGFDLLQIAIACDSQEIFDYLMTLDNYSIEHKTRDGSTALAIALSHSITGVIPMKEHYAYQLLKKGANFDMTCEFGSTPLHCALEREFMKVATILIENGVDLNKRNRVDKTPLETALDKIDDPCIRDELFAMLVVNGAEVTSEVLTKVLQNEKCFPSWIQETVFLYLFDEASETEITLDFFLSIARDDAFFFQKLIQCNIVITPSEDMFLCHQILHSLDNDIFMIIVTKFIENVKLMFDDTEYLFYYWCANDVNMEFISILMENGLRSAFIEIFELLPWCYTLNIYMDRYPYDVFEQLFCFFLSYNLRVNEKDLHCIYKKYGHCSLFKTLLFMDIIKVPDSKVIKNAKVSFMSDVTMDLDKIFMTPRTYDPKSITELLKYFSDPKLKYLCDNLQTEKTETDPRFKFFSLHMQTHQREFQWKKNLTFPPKNPSLLELSRTAFRKYFLEFYNIKTSCQFYTRLNYLHIPDAYKSMISFEDRIY